MEERISKYIYLAPFNGAVSEIYTEPGAIINPGGRIAKVFNQEKMEVRLPISIDFIDKFQKTVAPISTFLGTTTEVNVKTWN